MVGPLVALPFEELLHLLPMPLLFFGFFWASKLTAQVRGAFVLRSPTKAFCWIADSSLEVFKRGEAERLTELLSWFLATSGVARSESTLLCVFPTCIFKYLLKMVPPLEVRGAAPLRGPG